MSLPPSAFTILIDERENHPYSFAGIKTELARLITGDYTVKGIGDFVGIERKSRLDLIDCLHHDRPRLFRQIDRLRALPHHLLIIEASPLDFELGKWPHRDEITPDFVEETILHWQFLGLRVHQAGTHERANRHVRKFLVGAANHYYKSYAPFCDLVHASLSATPTAKRAA